MDWHQVNWVQVDWPKIRFAEPGALAWLALLLPLLLLLFSRGQPTLLLTGSLALWRRALPEAQVEQLRAHRLRRDRTLWLTALCVLFCVLAAARPLRSGRSIAPSIAVVIDVSASMQALDADGQSRLALAKNAALAWLDRQHPDTQILLLTAGHWVTVLSAFEAPGPNLRRQLQDITAQDNEGALSPALELARAQLARALGPTRIVVFTDGALSEPMLPSAASDVHFERVGTRVDNLAITELDVLHEPATSSEQTSPTQVFISVTNFGRSPQLAELTLRQRNVSGTLAQARLHLEPGQTGASSLHFEATPNDQGAGLLVDLSPADALLLDNRAHAVVPLHAKQKVLLIARAPHPWLERAFRADPEVDFSTTTPAEVEQATLPAGVLLVFVGSCPKVLPTSPFVVFAPPAGRCLDAEVSQAPRNLPLTHWDEQDLRFRYASLEGLRLPRARPLKPDSAADALAWSRELPLIARVRAREQQGTLVGFDPEDSAWPLQTSFVVFVRNLVELARGQTGPGSRLVRTGQPLWLSVPTDVETVRVAPPRAEPFEVAAHDAGALVPAATQAGFYFFTWQGANAGSSLLATNLLSARESDLDPDQLVSGPSSARIESVAKLPEQSLAPLFCLLALGCVLLQAHFIVGLWPIKRSPRDA